jgi:hypothetical protein
MRFALSCLILVACSRCAFADHLTMNNGKVFEGQILQDNGDDIAFRLEHGVILVPKTAIQSTDKLPVIATTEPTVAVAPARKAKAAQPQPAPRIPAWPGIVDALAQQAWAKNLRPIPATVVDKGPMANVPYSSYRCGSDYEVNIYGDPASPAAVEVGIYRTLLSDAAAKERCIQFMASILGDPIDAKIVRDLNRRRDLISRYGVTIEVTPETAEDAYGAWWISVYDDKGLASARATPQEVEDISVPRSATAHEQRAADPTEWTSSDLGNARVNNSMGSGRGNVYVRGYYRKNGTYVSSYTRSSPGTGRGHR